MLGSKPQYAYTHDWLNNTDAHLLKCIVMTCNVGLIYHWRNLVGFVDFLICLEYLLGSKNHTDYTQYSIAARCVLAN